MPGHSLVHILDDDPAICRWAEQVLKTGGLPSAVYNTTEAFLGSDALEASGCLLLDYDLPSMNGLELLAVLQGRRHALAIIMITGGPEVAHAVRALKLGAFDYLEKPLLPERLLHKVHEALGVSRRLWIRLEAENRRTAQLAELTDREREVADLLAAGKNTKQIAAELQVSPKTIEHHRPRILEKLGVETVVELTHLMLISRTDDSFPIELQVSP